jgi:hypothetical protein
LRRSAWLPTVLSLIAIALLCPAPALADPRPLNPWIAAFGIPQSQASAIASGVVDAGTKPSAGAVVVLSALPPGGGDPVPLTQTTTDAAGKWSIGAAAAQLAAHANAAGITNYSVQSFDATGSSIRYFATVPGAASTTGITLNSTDSPIQTTRAPQIQDNGPIVTCHDTLVAEYTPWALIGYTADEAYNAAEHFTFSTGARSTFGVGVSTGTGWTFGGSKTISSDLSVTFPVGHGVQYTNFYGSVVYDKVQDVCKMGNQQVTTDSLEPNGFAGGFISHPAARIAMGYCQVLFKGAVVTKKSESGYQAHAGVSTSGIIGIDLEAETDYSSSVTIDYQSVFVSHPWCGLSDYPGKDSRLQTIHSTVIS